jgi:hypothetical protein
LKAANGKAVVDHAGAAVTATPANGDIYFDDVISGTIVAETVCGTVGGGLLGRRASPLDLAMTLIGDPRLLFLDEALAGLDPQSRRTMWQITRELAGSGITVFSPPETSTRFYSVTIAPSKTTPSVQSSPGANVKDSPTPRR